MNGQRSKEVVVFLLFNNLAHLYSRLLYYLIVEIKDFFFSNWENSMSPPPPLFFFFFECVCANCSYATTIAGHNYDKHWSIHGPCNIAKIFYLKKKQKHNVHRSSEKQTAIITVLLTETIWFRLTHIVSNKHNDMSKWVSLPSPVIYHDCTTLAIINLSNFSRPSAYISSVITPNILITMMLQSEREREGQTDRQTDRQEERESKITAIISTQFPPRVTNKIIVDFISAISLKKWIR